MYYHHEETPEPAAPGMPGFLKQPVVQDDGTLILHPEAYVGTIVCTNAEGTEITVVRHNASPWTTQL